MTFGNIVWGKCSFKGVNVSGEYGATPLHYAARYITKPTKTPNPTPFHTPQGSPFVKTKKSLRQKIQQKRFSYKKDCNGLAKRKFSSTTKGFKQFLDRRHTVKTPPPPPLDKTQPLTPPLNRCGTIHNSLDNIPIMNAEGKNNLKIAYESSGQVKSAYELVSQDTDQISENQEMKKEESFEYGYAKDKEDSGLEKPIVIIGELSEEDTVDVKVIDALIIPEVRNVSSPELDDLTMSPPLKPAIPWPQFDDDDEVKIKSEISESSSNEDLKKSSEVPLLSEKSNLKKTQKVPSVNSFAPEEMILRYLLEQRANVNAKDFSGSTPLHYAALRENVTAVKMLLGQKTISLEVSCEFKRIISLSFLIFEFTIIFVSHLTLKVPIPQNGRTHSNNFVSPFCDIGT